MGRVVDRRLSLTGVRRGTPTVCTRRKAAVLDAVWRVSRTPPGSESGACFQRGNAGTWESHLSPCRKPGMGDRVATSPGGAGVLPPCHEPMTDTTNGGSTQGIGGRATRKEPRDGEVAVVAAQSTEEGGAVRPKRPTGGQAPSGSASAGGTQGRDFARTNPDHGRPVDCKRAAAALLEEPYACIAHVRVCGGAGWVTIGSTRQATANSLRSCVAPATRRA